MNYFEYFGLSFDPFLKNAMQGQQSFLSRDFHNASEILRSMRLTVFFQDSIPPGAPGHMCARLSFPSPSFTG